MTEIPKMNLVMEVPLKDADTGEIVGTAILKATDAMGVYLAEMRLHCEVDGFEYVRTATDTREVDFNEYDYEVLPGGNVLVHHKSMGCDFVGEAETFDDRLSALTSVAVKHHAENHQRRR